MSQSGISWIYGDECVRRELRLRAEGCDAYCLFCMTDSEIQLAHELNRLNEECIALPFLRMKRRSAGGKHRLTQDVLLKGYIFIFVPKGYNLTLLKRGETSFRVLEREADGGLLTGEDRRYAQWALSQRGVLDVSQAVKVKDWVKIISGPLLDLEGRITGLSKRNQNYRVEFEMMGRKVDVWLPYELVEPAGEIKGKERTDG